MKSLKSVITFSVIILIKISIIRLCGLADLYNNYFQMDLKIFFFIFSYIILSQWIKIPTISFCRLIGHYLLN